LLPQSHLLLSYSYGGLSATFMLPEQFSTPSKKCKITNFPCTNKKKRLTRPRERTPSNDKNGWFDWIPPFLKLKDTDLLEKQSLDAYLFLRFLKMILLICFVGLCLTWPILFPVNITGGGKSKELDRLTIGNVKDPNRYYAHLFVSWIFLGL